MSILQIPFIPVLSLLLFSPVQLSLKESVIFFIGCTAQDGSVKQVGKRRKC